jgi:1-deoxy-D-xylulose-5-phosphate synthase
METFTAVRPMSGPHLMHVVTRKEHGCPAGDHVEKWHALPPGDDPATGRVRATSSANPGWTAVFGHGLTELMHEREAVVAITAAMPTGTGTSMVAAAHPSRFFDVGIAESHAVTRAAGLTTRALHPVVAIYSTFLQRADDNVIHDVALQRLPVVFAPDRARLVGEDGETHMRLYDLAYLLAVPRLVVTAPKDGREMLGVLESALAHDATFSLRYPRDGSPDVVSAMAAVPPGAVRDVGGAAAGKRGGGARGGDDGDDGPRGGRDAGGRGARRHGGELPIPEAVRRGHAPRAVRPSSLAPVVEEGTVTNGFGAMLAAVVHRAPNVRLVSHGCPTGSSARPRARGNSPRPGWMGRGSRSGSGPFTRARQLPGEGAIVGG